MRFLSTAYATFLMTISSSSLAHMSHAQGSLHDAEHGLIWLSLLLPVAIYGAWKTHKALQAKRAKSQQRPQPFSRH